MTAQPILVISDGGTLALLAAAAAADRAHGGATLWTDTADEGVRVSVQRQAELFGRGTEFGRAETAPVIGEPTAPRWLRAAYEAVRLGSATVVVPDHAGPELNINAVANSLDRALLVSRLVALEVGPDQAPEVRLPYVDLTDAQVADLVLDMDLPIWTCWWWDSQTPMGISERERWLGALRAKGWSGELPAPLGEPKWGAVVPNQP